jgi:hypothetical protein
LGKWVGDETSEQEQGDDDVFFVLFWVRARESHLSSMRDFSPFQKKGKAGTFCFENGTVGFCVTQQCHGPECPLHECSGSAYSSPAGCGVLPFWFVRSSSPRSLLNKTKKVARG